MELLGSYLKCYFLSIDKHYISVLQLYYINIYKKTWNYIMSYFKQKKIFLLFEKRLWKEAQKFMYIFYKWYSLKNWYIRYMFF